MKTFEKVYGKYVVSFNNSNEYVEVGPHYANPKFEGILIREMFSEKGIEFFGDQIEFFLKELRKIEPFDQLNRPEPPLVKLIHRYGYENFSSEFVIVISDYEGIRARFFMDVSHQFNFDSTGIRTHSPEFLLENIIEILKDANELLKKEEQNG
jgi:hypothetical protein